MSAADWGGSDQARPGLIGLGRLDRLGGHGQYRLTWQVRLQGIPEFFVSNDRSGGSC